MIVVSDTGPINYLLWIEAIDILPQLYETVVIPEAVRQELNHPVAPKRVRLWAASLPTWVFVRQPQLILPLPVDIGEQEAISLAVEMQADLILMDDRPGRKAADAQQLIVTGTLGVLEQAAGQGLIDLAEALERLQQTNFRAAPELLSALLARFSKE